MATTTNIGLTKPAGTDKALVSVINSNSDIIDSAAGGLMDAIAIVANGNTHAAISAGQYVYVHNHGTLAEGLYTANSAIAANATLTTSNLTADASGGLNALNSNIANGHLVAKYLNDTSKTAIQLLTADFSNVNLGDIQFYRIRPSDDNLYGFIVKHSATYAYGLFAGMNTGDSYNIVNSNGTWEKIKLATNSSIFISGTIGSRLALLDTTGDSYTIPATGMYKLSFAGTGGQIKMNGNVLFDNNVAVQFAVPFKQGASLSWTKAGGTCSIYRVE